MTLAEVSARLDHIDKSLSKGSNAIWDIAIKGMVPISIVIGAWVIGLEVRIATIESTRFTVEDSHKMQAAMNKYVEDHVAPDWLKESIAEIKEGVKENGRRINKLEIKMNSKQ